MRPPGFNHYQKLTPRGDNGGMVQRLHSKSRKGFNLIEAAIVLGLVGVVVGGIWAASAGVREQSAINQSISDVLVTVNNVRSLVSGSPASFCQSIGCTPNINVTAQMAEAGVLPAGSTLTTDAYVSSLLSTPDVIVTPMGVKIAYVSGDWSSLIPTLEGLKIGAAFINIDQPLCTKLIAAISSRFHDDTDLQFIAYIVNGVQINGTSFPIPPDAAASVCQPLSAGNNALGFFFNAF